MNSSSNWMGRQTSVGLAKQIRHLMTLAKLGANAILGVSLAMAVAGAATKQMPLYRHIADLSGVAPGDIRLPVPAFNIINGGSHAGNTVPFQEFMILPVGAASFSEAMRMGSEIYALLKSIIKEKYGSSGRTLELVSPHRCECWGRRRICTLCWIHPGVSCHYCRCDCKGGIHRPGQNWAGCSGIR